MSYSGYSRDEYASEARAILRERYKGEASRKAEDAIDGAYRDGASPAQAAQRAAFAGRLRRKERFWHGEGPQIESGYAEKNRIGSRRDWQTVMVGSGLNKRARFLGFRSIEGNRMAVWKVGKYLIAQTAVGPRHESHFRKPSGDFGSAMKKAGRHYGRARESVKRAHGHAKAAHAKAAHHYGRAKLAAHVGYAQTAHAYGRAKHHVGRAKETAGRLKRKSSAARAAWATASDRAKPKTGTGTGKGKFFIEHSRHGYSAVLVNRQGRSINVINGDRGDSEARVRAAARKHWPHAREVRSLVLSDARRS